ncbi:MAG: SnoaL-like domain [Actinomycetia bacterium]|nr:SnoaL-like domain [Actinomycetes bacterium]
MNARKAGEAYCERVGAGDADALMALFADDAVMVQPAREFHGADEIRGFYETNVLPFGVTLHVTSWVHDEPVCVFEFEARAAGSATGSHAVDHVTVGADGRITRLAVYYRR